MLPAPSPAHAYIWKVDGIDLSVVLSNAVLAKLRALLEDADTPDPAEIGGFLLGRSVPDGAGFQTFVDAFEPFVLENRYGPNYTLSGRDSRRLAQRRGRRRRDGLVAVGLWRSHCRRGLYLDQRDFALFRRLFPHPSSLFLLVRRDEGAARGAVFVWEDDDIRRHASYLEFPLEAVPSEATLPSVGTSKAETVAAAPLPLAADRKASVADRNAQAADQKPHVAALSLPLAADPSAQAVDQKPHAAAAPLPSAADRKASVADQKADTAARKTRVLQQLGRPAWWRSAAMVTLGLALPVAAFYMGRAAALSRHRAVTVTRVNSAPPPPRPDLVAATAPPLPEALPAEQPAVADSRDRVGATPAAKRPRPLEIPPPKATATASSPSLPEPPRVAPRLAIAPLPAIVTATPAPPAMYAKGVTAFIKPAPSSGIRHALRRIFTGSRSAEGFVPASPVAHPLPALPQEDIPEGETSVELLARIDRTGTVAHVKFADGNSDLTEPSASALSQWRFEPARQNGAPVDCELLVRFEFRKP